MSLRAIYRAAITPPESTVEAHIIVDEAALAMPQYPPAVMLAGVMALREAIELGATYSQYQVRILPTFSDPDRRALTTPYYQGDYMITDGRQSGKRLLAPNGLGVFTPADGSAYQHLMHSHIMHLAPDATLTGERAAELADHWMRHWEDKLRPDQDAGDVLVGD